MLILLLALILFNARLSVKCCRLEQCLKEVVDYVYELSPGTLQHSADAADALRQVSDCRLIEKHTCCDVSMDTVHQVLKQMVCTLSIIILINFIIIYHLDLQGAYRSWKVMKSRGI